ncbi:photoreceptor ankyrin repeat protein [Corythoichthys intestinalis]|uniref:photoreceptor ankyrin repeat protein n=1 Tax=Corythoichthys intestinalis TaxID=161448 RepID=UPI0025A59CF3|nr:photoreceptor ankyrin repeat protein [Corythoichthys intestinalis]XP_057686112.1 photoreceptor ankyrin repeat protein [Corythoichthys intestinalis]XP_061802703.1 photoreceptor ankyrin repeat protein [Nerophis lumbriciformis]
MASSCEDPHLGTGPSEDSEINLDDSDTGSILSDDSVLPNFERDDKYAEPPRTLYEACVRNDPVSLRRILERGVNKEEAMELDINSRNGLMVAVSKGFIDVITTLHVCPLIDINHQDNDGNSALMIAAQAGFATILNYILNYYSGVDTEVRDPRGFTALIKAGLQGREDCVSALLMHGADMNAMDYVQGRGLKDWVLRTGRFETMNRIRYLQTHPVAEQFCDNYKPEWPELKQLVAKATASKSTGQKLRQRLKDSFTFSFPQDPQYNGVMDHMVRMTTSIHSPLVVTACHPLCPSSPPEIGKRRLAVPELLEKHSSKELEESTVSHSNGSLASFSSGAASVASVSLTSCCQETERRESVPPGGMRGFIPRSMAHRNSIFPSGCVPKIEVTRSGEPTPKKEKKKKRQKGYLEPPVWKYKEAKEEKKREKKIKEQERIAKGSKS